MQRLLVFTLLGSAAAFHPDDRNQLKNAVDACSGAMTDCTAADGTHIAVWDVSGVADMNFLFANNAEANPDLSAWDVGQVTKMNGMFFSASAFDGDLSAWDVGQVTHMGGMFDGASVFNGDLSAWDVGRVIYMNGMFWKASAFDQDLSAWNVEQVINMALMFKDASAFSQDLSMWDVSGVINMNGMFYDASAFNHQLCGPTWVASSAAQTDMFTGSDGGGIATEACELCPAGQYIKNGDCSNCEAGTYRSGGNPPGACVKCPAETYGTEKGQTSEGACTNCPTGWSTFDDAATVCNPSYQTHTDLLVDASQNCQTVCPDSCAGASADVLVNAILNNPTAYQQAGLCT